MMRLGHGIDKNFVTRSTWLVPKLFYLWTRSTFSWSQGNIRLSLGIHDTMTIEPQVAENVREGRERRYPRAACLNNVLTDKVCVLRCGLPQSASRSLSAYHKCSGRAPTLSPVCNTRHIGGCGNGVGSGRGDVARGVRTRVTAGDVSICCLVLF